MTSGKVYVGSELQKVVSKNFENPLKDIIKTANFFWPLVYIVQRGRCSQIEAQLKRSNSLVTYM